MVNGSSALATDRTGTTVAGKYRLSRLIGTGSMGAVYAAVHQFTGRHCALKLIDASFADGEDFAARFLREARSAAQIGHPTICDVLDAGQDPDGSLYLALELLEGRTLDAAIEADDLRVDEIVEIGTQLCDGLAAAHESGIVHRDIKPENIFLTWDEHGDLHVKILDFGVAKRTKGGPALVTTQQGAIFGTPYYMAPEQAAGDPVDERADIWAAGAVLFHALTGRPPFDEESYNKLIAKLMTQEPPRLRELKPDAPEYLFTAVDGALQRDADVRWQSARTMAEALRLRGSGEIDLDWELHEDHTVRTEGMFDSGEDEAPALAALSAPSNELPTNVEIDVTYMTESKEFPQFDGGGGPTIRSELPPAVEAAPRAARRQGSGLLIGLALGFGIAAVAAVATGWILWAHVLGG